MRARATRAASLRRGSTAPKPCIVAVIEDRGGSAGAGRVVFSSR
jgi:hypothetical protein